MYSTVLIRINDYPATFQNQIFLRGCKRGEQNVAVLLQLFWIIENFFKRTLVVSTSFIFVRTPFRDFQ